MDFITDLRLNSVPCKYNTTGPVFNTIPDITKMKSQRAGECQRHRYGHFYFLKRRAGTIEREVSQLLHICFKVVLIETHCREEVAVKSRGNF